MSALLSCQIYVVVTWAYIPGALSLVITDDISRRADNSTPPHRLYIHCTFLGLYVVWAKNVQFYQSFWFMSWHSFTDRCFRRYSIDIFFVAPRLLSLRCSLIVLLTAIKHYIFFCRRHLLLAHKIWPDRLITTMLKRYGLIQWSAIY